MTQTLGAAALQLNTATVGMFLLIPPEEQPELQSELKAGPFVEHAVSSATCPGDRGANHTAPLPIWTARCSQNCRYRREVVSIRWRPKYSQHQSRRRGWRVWQRLHQFQSWLRRRLNRKTPKKLPQGRPERRPGASARRAFLLSSAQRKRQSTRDHRLLLRRRHRWTLLLWSNSQCMPLWHIVSMWKLTTPWLLFGGAGLVALYVLRTPLAKLMER